MYASLSRPPRPPLQAALRVQQEYERARAPGSGLASMRLLASRVMRTPGPPPEALAPAGGGLPFALPTLPRALTPEPGSDGPLHWPPAMTPQEGIAPAGSGSGSGGGGAYTTPPEQVVSQAGGGLLRSPATTSLRFAAAASPALLPAGLNGDEPTPSSAAAAAAAAAGMGMSGLAERISRVR